MSAHTPGPWTVVAIDWGETGNARLELKEIQRTGMADARLIAAAPDLLAALQALVAELDGPGKPYSSDSYAPPQFIETARAAIAKATNRRATFFGGAEHGEAK